MTALLPRYVRDLRGCERVEPLITMRTVAVPKRGQA